METPRDRQAVLHGWKEIADYLQKSVRTVQRWERDLGLPVSRVSEDSSYSVLARRNELDAWMAQPRCLGDIESATTGARIAPPERRQIRWFRGLTLGGSSAAIAGIAAAIGLGTVLTGSWLRINQAIDSPRTLEPTGAARQPPYMFAAIGDAIVLIDAARPTIVNAFLAAEGNDVRYTAGTVSSDGRDLVLTTETPEVVLFDMERQQFTNRISLPLGLRTVKARLTNDGKRLLVIEQLGRLFVIDVASGTQRAEIALPRELFDAVSNRADTGYLIPSRDADVIAFVNAVSHSIEAQIDAGDGAHDVVTTRDRMLAFVSNEYDGTVTCLNMEARRPIGLARVGSHPISLAISADDESVFVANRDDGSVSVVDVAKCTVRQTIANAASGGPVGVLDVSQDGRTLVVSRFDGGGIFALDISGDRARQIGRIETIAPARAIARAPSPPVRFVHR